MGTGGMLCFGLLIMVCDLNAPKAPPVPDTYCQITKPFRWHKNDTRGTKEEADARNRQWRALCGTKPPSKK